MGNLNYIEFFKAVHNSYRTGDKYVSTASVERSPRPFARRKRRVFDFLALPPLGLFYILENTYVVE